MKMRSSVIAEVAFSFIVMSAAFPAKAEEKITTVVDPKSPDFVLGKATRRGMLIRSQDNPDMSLSIAARLQGSVEAKESAAHGWVSDVYGRRIRLEAVARLTKTILYQMDLRNDEANRGDGGERGFAVGDAFLQVRELGGVPWLNFQGFRGKIDVSRTLTVTSGQQLYYERPHVAVFAQQFVSHNRRAPNLQLFGSWEGKVRYQVAAGDGVASTTFLDAKGKAAASISKQDPVIGGKIVLSPIPGWEENDRNMTYFGTGHSFSVGAGYFRTNAIHFKPAAAAAEQTVSRGLLNVEAALAWGPLFVQAEYFNFSGVTEDFGAGSPNTGDSDGWYVTGEYVLSSLGYLAPTFRYEKWNRFRQAAGYHVESAVVGLNWYILGNSLRAGVMLQRDWLGANVGNGTENIVRVISQILL